MGSPPTSPGTPAPVSTSLAALAELSNRLEATKSRLELLRLVGDFLRELPPADLPVAARLLVGQPFPEGDPRKLDVSGTILWGAVCAVATPAISAEALWSQAADFGQAVERLFAEAGRGSGMPALSLQEVAHTFEAVAAQHGKGARREREALLSRILGRASPSEAKFLAKCILGDMRHGVNQGMLLEAVARATGLAPDAIRRAAMLLGDVGEVAHLAFEKGADALTAMGPRLFQPLRPMLAQTAATLEEAWGSAPGRLALEFKLDGARVQVHLDRDEVRLFSRRLHDVTGSLPEVAAEVRGTLKTRRAILEGEVVAVDASGRVRPFQDLLQRYRRMHRVERVRREVPLRLFLFDLLLEGDVPVLDLPYQERWQRLESVHGGIPLVPRCVPHVLAEAEAFWQEALAAGHEGVMLKRLEGRYTPGIRGSGWLKLKRVDSLDLVIIAADYGYGRRHGWLSNYHLAARDEETGEFRPVGKTFKGLTDDEFRGMTARLLALKRHEEGGTVWVSPKVVVEVQYSAIQKSALYPDGMALRFARIARIRDDKAPEEADTIQHMRRLFERRAATPVRG
jgi:DNA ligase-1